LYSTLNIIIAIKSRKMGEACGTYWKEEKWIQGGKTRRKETTSEDLGLDGRLLKLMLKKWDGLTCTVFSWIIVGAGGRVLTNEVTNFEFNKMREFLY
jgi:hypothetical protein